MLPHPPEIKAEARRLHVEQGLSYSVIGRLLGITPNTVRLWIDDEHRLAKNVTNKLRKVRYRGTCIDCGASTAHRGGKNDPKASIRCLPCHRRYIATKRLWTKEKVIAAIQRWAKEHEGRPPSASQWIRRGEYWPAVSAVYDAGKYAPFKSWNEAIAAAGFTPRPSSPGPGKITWSKEEGARLRAEGLPDTVIGPRLGVTASAIQQSLGPRPKPPPVPRKRQREERIADLRKALEKENP